MFHSATLAETEYSIKAIGAVQSYTDNKVERPFGLRRWLTAAAASLSLIAATAAPAHADRASDDLAKALVAALAVGALVNSLNKDHVRADPPAPTPVHRRRHAAPTVPDVCAFEINGRHRTVTVYPERCLRREGFDYRLPKECGFDARVFGRRDRVYSESCLADAGFDVEGRRGWGHDFPKHDRPGYGRPMYRHYGN